MAAPFEGQIAEVLVEPGAVVTEGQPLVKLQTYTLEQQLVQATELRLDAEAVASLDAASAS